MRLRAPVCNTSERDGSEALHMLVGYMVRNDEAETGADPETIHDNEGAIQRRNSTDKLILVPT